MGTSAPHSRPVQFSKLELSKFFGFCLLVRGPQNCLWIIQLPRVLLARTPQKQILLRRRARFGTRLYLRGCAETGTLSSSRVWCAPAGPARTARREPARPSRACWRAVACTSPSTRRNALCRLCVVAHGLGWRGWPAGTETPTHCGWPRLAKAWRPPCACSGASGAGGRVSWPPPRAAGSPPRFPAKVCHKAGRRHGASTRCRER